LGLPREGGEKLEIIADSSTKHHLGNSSEASRGCG
jgi:hypothetical protein